jgi:hypothetical protein
MIRKTTLGYSPFFIFLLPLFFIINGYNDYFNFFPAKFVLVNFIGALLFMLVIFYGLKKIWKDQRKAALFAFLIGVFCMLFGFLHDAIKSSFPNYFISRYIFILPFSILFLTICAFILKSKQSRFIKTYQYLNLLLLILVTGELIRMTVLGFTYKTDHSLIDSRFTVYHQLKSTQIVPDSLKPDIFFLIFDCMPSSKALLAGAGFDNTATDSFLTEKKFYVAADARSNYNLTVHSVTSTLNMEYLQQEEIYKHTGIHMYFRSASSLLNNSLTKILSTQGYSIHQYQSLSFVNNEHLKGKGPFSQMLTMNYFYKTLPGRLYRDLAWNIKRINYGFLKKINSRSYRKKAESAAEDIKSTTMLVKNSCSLSNKPKFVYAHFMLPHPPYFFDSTGNIKPFLLPASTAPNMIDNSFFDQVKFANILIRDIVNKIQSENKKNTIIVIAGDHGVPFNNKSKDLYFQNLNAIYFPDGDYTTLYPGLSSVNTFRVILNKYFKSSLPILKDSSVWISPSLLPFED